MDSPDRDTHLCDVGRGAPPFSSVEFAEAVNSITANPLVHIELQRDPMYVTSEGEACRSELVAFLENVNPLTNPLCHSDIVRRSPRQSYASFAPPPPAHTADLPALVASHFPVRSPYGEMYRCSKSPLYRRCVYCETFFSLQAPRRVLIALGYLKLNAPTLDRT